MTSPTYAVAASWRRASESGDVALAASCTAQDIEIISPLTAQFRFHGREQARDLLRAVFGIIDEITFHTEVGDGSTRALFYRGRCGREEFEEAQLLRFDDAGLIRELTLFGRPLAGVTAVMAAIGPALLNGQRRPALAQVIAAATRPLAVVTRVGDRWLVPLADPNRPARRIATGRVPWPRRDPR